MIMIIFGLVVLLPVLLEEGDPVTGSAASACLVRRPARRPMARTTPEVIITINEIRRHFLLAADLEVVAGAVAAAAGGAEVGG